MPDVHTAKSSIAWKLGGIGLLIGALLIPLSMVESTLRERLNRRNEAVADITSSWGKEQTVVGPALVIPYRFSYKTLKDTVVEGVVKKVEVTETGTGHAWFLPEELAVAGAITPEKLHRGIYEAVVYRGSLSVSGRFGAPDFAALKIKDEQVQWEDAVVAVGVTDLRGTAEALQMKLGEETLRMKPGTPLAGYASGV